MQRLLIYLVILFFSPCTYNEIQAQVRGNSLDIPINGEQAIFVNGKKVETVRISPAGIKSLTILKGDKLTAPYGVKGTSVMLIETREETADMQSAAVTPGFSFAAPLLYIDGRKSDRALATIRPDKIETMTLLKGDNTLPYGEEGKNGVILIETKK